MEGFKSAGFPLFRILIAYLLGITISITWFPAPYKKLLLLLLCTGVLLLLMYLFFYQQQSFLKGWFIAPMLVYPVFVLLGMYLTLHADPRTSSTYFAGQHARQLLISAEEPGYLHGKTVRFKAHVLEVIDRYAKRIPAEGYLILIVKDTTLQVPFGRRFLIPASYQKIPPPSNPAAFDYQSFQALHQVFHQCSLQKKELYALKGQDAVNLTSMAFKIQDFGAGIIERRIHGQGASSFLSAMVTGQRSGLPAMLYQAFSRTGTVHIISISGMHVHIVFTLLGWLVCRFKRSSVLLLRLLRKGFLISLIWFYALISGFSPAVCRCALMIMLLLCTEHLDYKVSGPLMLSLSAFILLLVQPWLLEDMGFQLSYLAVAGLHTFQGPVKKLIHFQHPFLRAFWDLSATSMAAQIFTFPVCLWYFHQFPVYFLFANLLIIPLTGLMLYLGIALLMLAWLPGIAQLISSLYEYLYRIMSWFLTFFSTLPGSVVEGVYINYSCLILLTCMLLSFHSWLTSRNRLSCSMFLLCTCMVLSQNLVSQALVHWQRKILFLNVPKQQGICLINGIQAYLVEPGAVDEKNYERIYRPALALLGVHSAVWIRGSFSQANLHIGPSVIRFGDWVIFLKKKPETSLPFNAFKENHVILYTENNYLLNAGELRQAHLKQVISGNENSILSTARNSALCSACQISCKSLRLEGGLLIPLN